MKSKYFKNLAKGLVVAGAAFALVNCGDAADQVNNAVAEAQQQYQDQQQGGGLATDPATNPSQTQRVCQMGTHSADSATR